jgi:hypothetical protein
MKRHSIRFALSLAGLLIAAGTASAHDTTQVAPPPATQPAPQVAPTNPVPAPPVQVMPTQVVTPQLPPAPPALVPERSIEDIRRSLETARGREQAFRANLEYAKTRVATAKSQVALKRDQVKMQQARAKSAKQTGSEGERIAAETSRKIEGTWLKVAEAAQQVEQGRLNALEERIELEKQFAREYDLELELAQRRTERDGIAATPGMTPDRVSAADRVIVEMERRTLQQMRTNAGQEGDVANKEKALADRRLKLLETWTRASGGR